MVLCFPFRQHPKRTPFIPPRPDLTVRIDDRYDEVLSRHSITLSIASKETDYLANLQAAFHRERPAATKRRTGLVELIIDVSLPIRRRFQRTRVNHHSVPVWTPRKGCTLR